MLFLFRLAEAFTHTIGDPFKALLQIVHSIKICA